MIQSSALVVQKEERLFRKQLMVVRSRPGAPKLRNGYIMFDIILQLVLVAFGALGGWGFGKATQTKPDEKVNVFNTVMMTRQQLLHISAGMWCISGLIFAFT